MKDDAADQNARRTILHAALYGLILRERGYTPEQAAQLVIEAYPVTRTKLGYLASRGTRRLVLDNLDSSAAL